MTINTYLETEKAAHLTLMRSYLDSQETRYAGLSHGYAKMLSWLKAFLLRGGKWHRPALAMLGYQLVGGADGEGVRQSFGALELLHRYLLIHDDILDRDLVRHHGPTMEAIYADYFTSTYPDSADVSFSKGMAMVAGDVVNSLAYELLLTAPVPDDIKTALTKALNQLLMETAAGWQMQTEQNFLKIESISNADIMTAMRLVSAQYSVVWPLRIGQVMAGRLSQSSWDQALDEYGLQTGLAFQIMDDLLGMFGDETKTGKPVGHDFREGKKTLLLLETYTRADANERKFIVSHLGTEVTPDEVTQVQQLMESTGALAYVQEQADAYAQKAQVALTRVSGASQHEQEVSLLRELSALLAHRSS